MKFGGNANERELVRTISDDVLNIEVYASSVSRTSSFRDLYVVVVVPRILSVKLLGVTDGVFRCSSVQC